MTVVARRLEGYSHEVSVRSHALRADEPAELGGGDSGPTPAELLAASLASCTAVTMEMYAERKGWQLGDVEVAVDFELEPNRPARFEVILRLPKELSEDQLERLERVAGKCPVHRALVGQAEIEDRLELV